MCGQANSSGSIHWQPSIGSFQSENVNNIFVFHCSFSYTFVPSFRVEINFSPYQRNIECVHCFSVKNKFLLCLQPDFSRKNVSLRNRNRCSFNGFASRRMEGVNEVQSLLNASGYLDHLPKLSEDQVRSMRRKAAVTKLQK